MSKVTKLLRKNAFMNTMLNELSIIKIWKRNWKKRPVIRIQSDYSLARLTELNPEEKNIFFAGVPTHNNMGDQAQKYCILKWIEENYPEHSIIELPTWAFYNKKFKIELKKAVKADDLFIIQSGYCTTSSHCDHPMHRFIVRNFKCNPVLIMPQTVLFNRKSDSKKTADIYAKHSKLLFLARDRKSYEDAKRFFKGTEVKLYPDIVTTLIGDENFAYSGEKNGVLICVRNDSEKYYSDQKMKELADRFTGQDVCCDIGDTDSKLNINDLQEKFEDELKKTISYFGKHQVVITDRYHGTIFSMISNTPVIVLETLDHKVKTGTEWFKGIYDGAYYNADSINEAYDIAMKVLKEKRTISNLPYLKSKYYDTLKNEFEYRIKGNRE